MTADVLSLSRTMSSIVTVVPLGDRKSTRLNSSHSQISYAVFCLKKKKAQNTRVRARVLGGDRLDRGRNEGPLHPLGSALGVVWRATRRESGLGGVRWRRSPARAL